MESTPSGPLVVDSLTLRFTGEEKDGSPLHELRASHVAEVLQGIVELSSDFDKAGALAGGPSAEVLVKPAKEGSFLLEVVRVVQDAGLPEVVALGTPPSLSTIVWWATKSMRAEVSDYTHLENGNVKVNWQDNTVQEIPRAAWDELQRGKRRRKKQLRKIMAPLSDERVEAVEVASAADEAIEAAAEPEAPEFTLTRPDYDAARPEDVIEESFEIFEADAQMSAIDFDDASKWRVKTTDAKREARVEDQQFLDRISAGLAIRKSDIFTLEIREDTVVKNGRTRKKWTVVRVKGHRRAVHDDDA